MIKNVKSLKIEIEDDYWKLKDPLFPCVGRTNSIKKVILQKQSTDSMQYT